MKRQIIIITIVALSGLNGISQIEVIPSAGYAEDTSYMVYWTLGKPFSGYATDGEYTISIGASLNGMIITALEDVRENIRLNVYPNPTYEYVFIRTESMDYRNLKVELYSLEGKLIQKKDMDADLYQLDFRGLPGGTYILKVLDDRHKAGSFKIIKLY